MPIHGYPGGVISATPPTVNSTTASGVWTTEKQLQYQAQGLWPMAVAQPISRSLRFNSADSAYLNRTPGSAGNRRTWTWSAWLKRSTLSSFYCLFSAGGDDNFGFSDTDKFQFYFSGSVQRLSTQVFRDASAWYHLVVVYDSPNATAQNRFRVYVNGTEITAWDTNATITQNRDGTVNNTVQHAIGYNTSGAGQYFPGYLTEINFIDGQALTPSSFGQTNSITGVWEPKAYSGTYGTNGFYLNFSDNSGTTSTTLGKDYSGNGNNWTPNNFSVTAGAGNDSLVDTPTSYGTDTGVGGEVRGNYCTWNSVLQQNDIAANTYANGNLEVSAASTNWANGTISVNTGSYYFELTASVGASGLYLGLNNTQTDVRITARSTAIQASAGGGGNQTGLASWSNGDIIGVAVNGVSKTVQFYRNGSTYGTLVTYTTALDLFPFSRMGSTSSSTVIMNAGQRPFAYTAPSGFKALCTQNLSTPTVVQGDDYFNTVLYTGNGSTQSITGVGFQPDLVWYKGRSVAYNNRLYDVIRGVTNSLSSNLTDAESAISGVTAFNSDGFSLGSEVGGNNNGTTYVAWNWKANGAGVTNTAGTITSTVSANQTAGFSVLTYTGTGSSGATVGHGLGTAPAMIIVKNRTNSVTLWTVYHQSLGATKYIELNNTNAAGTFNYWNDTAPTSTVFSLYPGGSDNVNKSGSSFVAYCFAAIPGYSAFGTYTGNGNADGTFVYTGFRPAWLLVKRTSSTGYWTLVDAKRNTYNVMGEWLYPNAADAGVTNTSFDFVSNGFKLRYTGGDANASGSTYIYAAFAENPFKYALAR